MISGLRSMESVAWSNMADHYADDMEKQTEYRTKVKEASHLLHGTGKRCPGYE